MTDDAKPFRWAGLVRVSSADQTGGAATQRLEIERWVAARGDELIGMFEDVGVPGTMEALPKRKGASAALGAIASGHADGVVVWKLDRLARDLVLQEQLIANTHYYGGVIASCQDEEMRLLGAGVDATRTLIRQVLGAVAQYERAGIKLRQTSGRERAKAEGRWQNGRPPYGYIRSTKTGRLVPFEHEQAIIGEGLQLRALGLTLNEIGEFFLQAGMPPRQAKTRVHARETVAHILREAEKRGIPRRRLSPLAMAYGGSRALVWASNRD